MKTIIIESPYRPIFKKCNIPLIGWIYNRYMYNKLLKRNIHYAQMCMQDALLNYNEAPFLSHLLYTHVLNDQIKEDREKGIAAGLEWYNGAYAVVFYVDYGYSDGMKKARQYAKDLNMKFEERRIIKYDN